MNSSAVLRVLVNGKFMKSMLVIHMSLLASPAMASLSRLGKEEEDTA
jgi:hypothetical protein